MSLDEVPLGARVLVDANIIIYYSAGLSLSCRRLLLRGERREVELYISAATLAEARHGLMIAEARSKNLFVGSNPARRLRENPGIVRQLSSYREIENALASALQTVDLTPAILEAGFDASREWGLLTNDALLVATAMSLGIDKIASADADLQRVTSFVVFAPDDLFSACADEIPPR